MEDVRVVSKPTLPEELLQMRVEQSAVAHLLLALLLLPLLCLLLLLRGGCVGGWCVWCIGCGRCDVLYLGGCLLHGLLLELLQFHGFGFDEEEVAGGLAVDAEADVVNLAAVCICATTPRG